MAQSEFSVQPRILIDTANTINDKTTRYEAEVAKIYSEIANLKVNWKGQTSDTFNQQIEGYRNDFNELAKILKDYATFLQQSAQKYTGTDANLASQAQKLSAGR